MPIRCWFWENRSRWRNSGFIEIFLKVSNLGLHYLSGAIAYDPSMKIDALLASKLFGWMRLLLILTVLLRIPIALVAQRTLVIDNGASFYFHHSWQNFDTAANTFKYVKDHVCFLKPQIRRGRCFCKIGFKWWYFQRTCNLILKIGCMERCRWIARRNKRNLF